MYLWVLSENIKGCFAFLETAPLSPFGHFPPLGAACDVKKKAQIKFVLNLYRFPLFRGRFSRF